VGQRHDKVQSESQDANVDKLFVTQPYESQPGQQPRSQDLSSLCPLGTRLPGQRISDRAKKRLRMRH